MIFKRLCQGGVLRGWIKKVGCDGILIGIFLERCVDSGGVDRQIIYVNRATACNE